MMKCSGINLGWLVAGLGWVLLMSSGCTSSGPAALKEKETMKKEALFTDQAPAPVGPYSQAIRVGPWLFLAGQIPIDPATQQMIEGDVEAQTRRVMDNIGAILKAAGGDFSHLVQVTIYLADLQDFPRVNQVYAGYFEKDPPARVTVGVAALPKGARLEIAAIAYLSETS